jgi:small subunit ribosomal protein S15
MALTCEVKEQIVKEYGRSPSDTGCPEVQVALLSKDIQLLTKHFEIYKKDLHSKRGLTAKVNKRRSLLDYLKRIDLGRYRDLIKRLGLRY